MAQVQAIPRRVPPSVKAKRIIFKVVVYALLAFGAVFVMIPLLWMISSSLKGSGEVFSYPPKFIPIPPLFSNYPRALTSEPFFRFAFNTTLITLLNIIGGALSSTLVGFAFSRLRWKGRDIMFLVCLATMMLPSQVTLIPQYVIFSKLKWVDTFFPLFVPAFFGVPFLIFLCRQFFTTIPRELDDAARIDGCGWFDIYWRIILPQAVPVLATCAIFLFNWNWNDFLGPLIYLNTKEKLTLTIGLSFFQSGTHGTNWQYVMAASVFSVAPVILIFFFAQRYFIQGIVFTGVKG
jgi:multiple sugar transport system permease protein